MEISGFRYLSAKMVERLRGMEIGVRRPMDGHHQGTHKSPAFGSSVEFAEYREYMPGDPITQIDWPVYARSDRYVIRRYHEDVSVRCFVLLDISESMSYKQAGHISKADYAFSLAAAMMYLMVQQGDTASLITFDSTIREHYEPAGSFTGLRPMLLGLEKIEAKGKSDIESSLHSAAQLIKGRTLVVIISDFLEDPQAVLRGVGHLQHDGKDVTLFHVLDPAELQLPQEGLVDVTELETGKKILVDWAQVRQEYTEQLQLYLEELRTGCASLRADYILSETRSDLYTVLSQRSRMT
jgi:uncharacterized protein (DUF58 family)